MTRPGYATTLLLFRPQSQVRVNLDAIRLQRQVLGPLTREEIWSALVLVGLVLGFATRPLHGIAPAWLAILAFVVGAAQRRSRVEARSGSSSTPG